MRGAARGYTVHGRRRGDEMTRCTLLDGRSQPLCLVTIRVRALRYKETEEEQRVEICVRERARESKG